MHAPRDLLRAKLNLETARLSWPDLERHFARGVVIRVDGGVDLVEAALQVAENNVSTVQAWLAEGRIAKAGLDDAEDWHARLPVFWAVVVAPWVLIQEVLPGQDD